MIELGKFNELRIVKSVDFGLYLDGGEDGEILLPSRYVPQTYEIGQTLRVFIYLDSEERLVATTLEPKTQVGCFACLKVNWINEVGAFLDWGLMKDLFVPFREQKQRMEVGRSYVVHTHVDQDSFRIVASAKVERYLSHLMPPYQRDDEVDVMVWQRTPLGYKVIVAQQFSGMLYNDGIFRELLPGMSFKAYVVKVREDGKIDLSLQKPGAEKIQDFSRTLLERIQESGGFLPFGDKTPSEVIYTHFQVSKKTFKKAVGDLYKKRLILLEEDGIRLV